MDIITASTIYYYNRVCDGITWEKAKEGHVLVDTKGQVPYGDDQHVSRKWYAHLGKCQMFDPGFLQVSLF